MVVRVFLCSLLLTFSVALETVSAQGIIFPGAGALNRSMAGVSTAAPMDAAGATYWNPAAISGLRHNEVFVGVDLMYADTFMGAAVNETGRFGENRSNSGLAASPALALVYRPSDSTFSYGLNVTSLVGRNIDFPGSEFNPILTAYDPPNSRGIGPVSTQMSGLQISPMVSKWITDSWAVGGGVTVNSMSLALDPALWANPNANGTLPPATHSRPVWGFGFQGGVYYSSDSDWKFGASFKSKSRYEAFDYSSKDHKGYARDLTLDVSLPMVVSFGVAYEGLDRVVIASDVRYLDYKNTDLFGAPPAQGGLGWDSVWSFAVGGRLHDQRPSQDSIRLFHERQSRSRSGHGFQYPDAGHQQIHHLSWSVRQPDRANRADRKRRLCAARQNPGNDPRDPGNGDSDQAGFNDD